MHSIMNKTGEVLSHLEDENCDVCLVQETYLKATDSAKIQEIRDNGWNIFSSPRGERGGGGIGILFRDGVSVKMCPISRGYKSFQIQEVLISDRDEPKRLCNIYRPPYTGKARFTEAVFLLEFEDYLTDLMEKPGSPILCGDFNIQVHDSKNFYAAKFLELIDSFGLEQHVPLQPTHIRGGTLDLVISLKDRTGLVKNITIHPGGTTSDHFMVSFGTTIRNSIENTRARKLTSREYRNFKGMDLEGFQQELECVDPEKLLGLTTEETAINLRNFLDTLVEKYVPLKRVRIGKKVKPWRDEELRTLLREKRKAERVWRKTKCHEKKLIFNVLKRDYGKMDKQKRMEYVRNDLGSSKDDMKALQRKLQRLLGSTGTILPETNDEKSLAEEFAGFFKGKVERIRKVVLTEQMMRNEEQRNKFEEQEHQAKSVDVRNLKNEDNSVYVRKWSEEDKSVDKGNRTEEDKSVDMRNRTEEVKSVDNDQRTCQSRWTEFEVITNDKLVRIVKDMANKHCGLDPMPTDVVKKCLAQLSPLLTALVNQSLSESSVPSDLQQALVFPTIKNAYGDRDSLSNYRPVSNIPFLSKLLEKVVLEQLSDYLKRNELLGKHQSGYRIGHSCETLLASMFDDFLGEMDKGKVVALICLDMSAAFDTVDHQSLLKELHHRFGIGGAPLMWFESYLSSRNFRVSVGDSFSEMVNLICGVPQGSLLGPVLFLLYIEELQDIVSRYGLNIKVYADDSQLYVSLSPSDPDQWNESRKKVERCLSEVKKWMVSRWLKCNEDKTEFILLGKSSAIEKLTFQPSLMFGDVRVEPVDCKGKTGKTLGILLDQNLTLERQVNNVRKQCGFTLRNLWQVHRAMDIPTKILMVKQLIISKLDYCNVLYCGLPKRIVDGLQKVLNSCIRFIYNLHGHQDDYTRYFMQSHILPAQQRLNFKACLTAYKIVHGLAPIYMQEQVPLDENWGTNRTTRMTDILDPYRLKHQKMSSINANSKLRKRRISVYLPEVWNSLSLELRSLPSVEQFKARLKTFLYIEAFGDSPTQEMESY